MPTNLSELTDDANKHWMESIRVSSMRSPTLLLCHSGCLRERSYATSPAVIALFPFLRACSSHRYPLSSIPDSHRLPLTDLTDEPIRMATSLSLCPPTLLYLPFYLPDILQIELFFFITCFPSLGGRFCKASTLTLYPTESPGHIICNQLIFIAWIFKDQSTGITPCMSIPESPADRFENDWISFNATSFTSPFLGPRLSHPPFHRGVLFKLNGHHSDGLHLLAN